MNLTSIYRLNLIFLTTLLSLSIANASNIDETNVKLTSWFPWLNTEQIDALQQIPDWGNDDIPEVDGKHFGNSDASMAPPFAMIMNDISSRKEIPKVLDVGCGLGGFTRFACLSAEVIATDICSDAIQFINEKSTDWQPLMREGTSLVCYTCDAFSRDSPCYRENSFDIIVIKNVMHFFSPIRQTDAIQVIWEKLNPGGSIYITVNSLFHSEGSKNWFKRSSDDGFPGYHIRKTSIDERIDEYILLPPDRDLPPGISYHHDYGDRINVRCYHDYKSLRKVIESAGIEPLTIEFWHWNPITDELQQADENFIPNEDLFYSLIGIITKSL